MIAQTDRTEGRSAQRFGDTARIGVAGLVVGALAALCALLGAAMTGTQDVDGYGLIRALPLLYWLGVVLAVAATFLLVWVGVSDDRNRHAAAAPLLWLVVLHLAPGLAHDHVRHPGVWAQLGLIRRIHETGTADVVIDARFAWPGFLGTFIAPLANLDGPLLDILLRAWPACVTGGTAVLVAALARRSYPTVPLIGSVSALVHVLLAWMGNDYFSSQSIGVLWFASILVILESGPLQTGSAWSAAAPVLPRFATSGGDRPASRSTTAFVALVVLSFGAIVSHPLAPFLICAALLVLGLYGRSLAWRLLLFVGIAYLAWFGVSAEPWWSNPLGESAEQFGAMIDGVPTATDGPPSTEGSPERALVITVRTILGLGTVVAVLVAGASMAIDRFRHLRPSIPLVPLAVVTVLAIPLVGYGEATLGRLLPFVLPVAAVLIGRVLTSLSIRSLPVAGALCAVVLCPLLLLARFGDERFEFTTEADRAAIEAAYDRADDDTLFVADNPFVPWRDQTVGLNGFIEQPVEPTEEWVRRVEAEASEAGKERIIVVLTDSQVGWSVHGEGLSADTLDEFADWLVARPGSDLVFHAERSWAIEL